MKRYLIIIALLIALGTISAESPVGIALRMRGEITLTRNEAANPLNEGKAIINNDIVRSYEESFALIKFIDDGATLRLFENSVLTLNTEKEDDKLHKNNYLQIGNVFTSVRSNRGDLTVETPTTVASVKGTDGFVTVDENGNTLVIVIKGSYDVYNKISGDTKTVGAGNTCSSDSSGDIDIYETTDLDEDLLDAIEDITWDSDIYRIEIINEDGEKRIIEIELD